MSSHPITHIEFSATDQAEAARFYGDVFGWQTQRIDAMDYTTFNDGKMTGGFPSVSEQMPAGTILIFIETADIASSVDKVQAHGGTLAVPPTEAEGVGTWAIFKDPTGNMVGLLQHAEHPPG